MSEAKQAALAAKMASQALAQTTEEQRNKALFAMAAALREGADTIIAANEKDVAAARSNNTPEPLIDRLMLDADRIEDIAQALEDLAALPDPTGRVLEHRVLPNGLDVTRLSVPLGVVAVIYEARPNVTADAAGICLKAGNACVLRGGSMAVNSNLAIADLLDKAAVESGLPEHSIIAIASTDRAETAELLSLRGLVDVLIPRGGAGLIQHCVENALVPVIETGTGNCHVYVHESADLDMAKTIIMNAKCRRYGVCNAAETLLVDSAVAEEFLPGVLAALAEKGVIIHGDELTRKIAQDAGLLDDASAEDALQFEDATEVDWATEYLAPELAIKCINGVDEAIEHINTYGTKHSESIVATEDAAIEAFLNQVDASSVYANASTAFTDGGQFGLGAEIGISTQKLHARGPFALEALTTYKYVVRGDGQVRA